MPRHRVLVLLPLLAVLGAAGCSSLGNRFTFMRPDVSRKDFTRTAPEYDVGSDRRRGDSLAARERTALAERKLRTGRIAEAEVDARAALKLDPKSVDAHTLLGVIAQQRGDHGEAGGYYAKAAELAPGRGSVLNNYGAWLCSNGRAAESLAWFDRALADQTYPTPASAQANAGSCALAAGQAPRAERDLRAALQADPENAIALAAMARLELAGGNYLSARAFSQRRIAAAPVTPEVLRVASQIEKKLGDNQASARYLERLASEFPAGDASTGETRR